MYKIAGYFLSLLALLSISQIAAAQSFYDQQDSAAYAGLYMSVPLGTADLKKANDYKLGFKAGFQRNMRLNNNGLLKQQSFTADVVDLRFSSQGFKQFSFAGTPMVYTDLYGRLHYVGEKEDGDEEDKGGSRIGTILLWTAGIAGGLTALILLGSCVDSAEDEFVDFCALR